jgi:RNA-directed DNA polymerase
MAESKSKAKLFVISKKVVLEAWESVRDNQGGAGVDGQSIEDFERDLSGSLYRIWNRLSSGTYMPPPVKEVKVPKKHALGVLLYVDRWLKAPIQQIDGITAAQDRGTPQGSAISPVLANVFLRYAFDAWMSREFPAVPFERYADDLVAHCKSKRQAGFVLGAITTRMASLGLELNSDKTRIVYCKDSNRKGSHEHERFVFLGYGLRPRKARNHKGELFTSFTPAISDEAAKKIRRTIRRWRLHIWSGASLTQIARHYNKVVHGWVNYHGKFYQSQLALSLRSIEKYLVRWAMRKYKRLTGRRMRAWELLDRVAIREPRLFAHWQVVRASDWTVGAV